MFPSAFAERREELEIAFKDPGIAHGSTGFIVMAAKHKKYDKDFVYYIARLPEFRNYAHQEWKEHLVGSEYMVGACNL